MLYAAIDIHKRSFQAAVLDSESGQISEQRFGASSEELSNWAMSLQGGVAAVAIEATTGCRWVWRELAALGFDVRLADPSEVKALRGTSKRAKTDRLDARWLVLLLAKHFETDYNPSDGTFDAWRLAIAQQSRNLIYAVADSTP